MNGEPKKAGAAAPAKQSAKLEAKQASPSPRDSKGAKPFKGGAAEEGAKAPPREKRPSATAAEGKRGAPPAADASASPKEREHPRPQRTGPRPSRPSEGEGATQRKPRPPVKGGKAGGVTDAADAKAPTASTAARQGHVVQQKTGFPNSSWMKGDSSISYADMVRKKMGEEKARTPEPAAEVAPAPALPQPELEVAAPVEEVVLVVEEAVLEVTPVAEAPADHEVAPPQVEEDQVILQRVTFSEPPLAHAEGEVVVSAMEIELAAKAAEVEVPPPPPQPVYYVLEINRVDETVSLPGHVVKAATRGSGLYTFSGQPAPAMLVHQPLPTPFPRPEGAIRNTQHSIVFGTGETRPSGVTHWEQSYDYSNTNGHNAGSSGGNWQQPGPVGGVSHQQHHQPQQRMPPRNSYSGGQQYNQYNSTSNFQSQQQQQRLFYNAAPSRPSHMDAHPESTLQILRESNPERPMQQTGRTGALW